ncbi:MAG: phytanoyl-CoA dioxygenase family protein [Verrucomicrobiales bacterium]|nr:phytanoyl-CoA dioxygenase family protein [Verrucomicrobiales bacterium]
MRNEHSNDFELTSNRISKYQEEGYLLFPSFLNQSEVHECKQRIDNYIEKIVPEIPGTEVFYEDKNDNSSLKQLQRMHEHDPWFHELFTGKIKQLAQQLLGADVITKNLQYFNKPPKIGAATPPHQDGFYFKLDPPKALTMWLALNDANEENGCVRYVKGSHLKGIREHDLTGTLGFSQGISNYGNEEDTLNEVPVPASEGDLIAHDSLTIHLAGKNLSNDRPRRALGFIFYSSDAKENSLAINNHQEELKSQQRGKI